MLEQLYQDGLIFDVELYRNCLVISFYSLRVKEYRTYVWYGDRNEVRQILQLVKKRILIGFNSHNYDCAVLDYLIDNPNCTLLELWEFSQTLIRGGRNPYRWKSSLNYGIDLLEVMRAGFSVTSLKMAAVTLKHETIQDLPIPYDSEIQPDELDVLIKYNINDLDITHKILEYLKPRLEMRELLSDNYKLNLHSASDSGIGKELFSKLYVDKVKEKYPKVDTKQIKYSRTNRTQIKFADVIHPSISFKTPELQQYLEQIKLITLTKEEHEYEQYIEDNNQRQQLQVETTDS